MLLVRLDGGRLDVQGDRQSRDLVIGGEIGQDLALARTEDNAGCWRRRRWIDALYRRSGGGDWNGNVGGSHPRPGNDSHDGGHDEDEDRPGDELLPRPCAVVDVEQ